MKVLNCETIDSTYESLEHILGTTKSLLESVFERVDVERFYRDNPRHPQPPEDLVFSEVRKVATLSGKYVQIALILVSNGGFFDKNKIKTRARA